MSYGNGNQFIVDWTSVRKWAGADPVTTIGAREINGSIWTGTISTNWFVSGNWNGGVPTAGTNVVIPDVVNQPLINARGAMCLNLIINSGAEIGLAGTDTLTVSGNWANNGGTFTSAGGTVVFNGTSQTIGGTTSTAFNNITISSSLSTTLGVNITVGGDLNVRGGIFDLGTHSCNRSSAGGTLMIAAGATLKIGGNGTLPSNYSTHSIGTASIIDYYGSDQTVAALNSSQTYGNLVLSGSGTKSFPASRAIAGNLTIKGTAQAFLADGTNSSANSLILGSAGQSGGTWGSTSVSPAPDHTNDTYFSSTGILTVGASFTAGTWLGGISEDWSTATNWHGASVPGAATDVIIPDFAAFKPTISGMATPALCNNLTINQGATLSLDPGQALTVSGNLTNNGSLLIESSWVNSSGSLIVIGIPSGTGTVSYKRFLREGNDYGDKHLLSSPVAGQSITSFIQAHASMIDSVRIWDETAGVWSRVTSGVFTNGKGYNIYQADGSDGEFIFAGSLINSASITATSPFEDPFSSRGSDPYGTVDPAHY